MENFDIYSIIIPVQNKEKVMEKVIEIENLTKSYGKFKAIDDLSIYVEKGKIFGLLGPNGSGK